MNKSSMSNPSSGDQDNKIAEQAKQAVTHVASNLAHQTRDQVSAEFDTRKDKAVETIGNVADAIRETSDKLKGVGPLGDVAGKAADGIEKVADFFEGKQIGDVVRDVERFARREPALFVGAAFAIGLIGGRFLKSSAHRSGSSSASSSSYPRYESSDFERYEAEASYASYGDDESYLGSDDLEEALSSKRFGYGMTADPQPPQPSQTSSSSSRGSASSGATQASPRGSSFGSASSGTSTTGASTGASSTSPTPGTAGANATAPTPVTSSTSKATPADPPPATKSGLGGGLGGGSMGSV